MQCLREADRIVATAAPVRKPPLDLSGFPGTWKSSDAGTRGIPKVALELLRTRVAPRRREDRQHNGGSSQLHPPTLQARYAHDEQGRWFFQNGPQRVFVSLAYAPYVVSTCPAGSSPRLVTHTGSVLEQITGAWIDEDGTIILRWTGGDTGSVSDRDLAEIAAWFTDAAGRPLGDEAVAKAIETRAAHGTSGIWLGYGGKRVPVGRVMSDQVPTKFGFVRSPRPAPGEPDC